MQKTNKALDTELALLQVVTTSSLEAGEGTVRLLERVLEAWAEK